MKFPNTLYCAILRSHYAHARILRVDVSKALSHPNVRAVITGLDARQLTEAVPPYLGAPVLQYCLAVDKVRFVGEPVAAVAATDRYSAADALELIDVEYEPLTAVLRPQDALMDKSPLVFEELRTNIAWHKTFEFGNVEEAFARADERISFKLYLHRYTSTPLETFVCTSYFDRPSGILNVWSNTQNSGLMHKYLCKAIRMDGNRVRMQTPADVGGGFGIKSGGLPYVCIVSLLSMKTGSPVNWFETRTEHLLAQGHSADGVFEVEAAATRSGILTGLKIKDINGEGGDLTWASMHNIGKLAAINGNYRVKNILYDGYAVATNKAPAVPNRGIGKKGINLMIERAMDKLADRLSIDRIEIRRRNFLSKEQFPYENPSGQLYDSSDYLALLERLLKMCDYVRFKDRQLKERKRGRYLGLGVTCSVEPGTVNFSYHSTGGPKPLRSGAAEGARVKIENTGKITVLVGSVSNGQGHETSIAQVVSDELQVPLSSINVLGHFDSFMNPWTVSSGVYSNKFSVLDVAAVAMAARKVRKKATVIAAHLLNSSPEQITIRAGIFSDSASNKSVTYSDVADCAYNNLLFLPPGAEPGLEELSFYSFPQADLSTSKGKVRSYLTFASSVHAAIVEVDTETGKISIEKYFVADDYGNMINPMLVEGQVHGNIFSEASAALLEEIVYDDEGQLLSSTFTDYLSATAKEMLRIDSEFISNPSQFTVLGTKSVGDGPAIAVLATIASAIEDALSTFNVQVNSFPLSPERVFKAIRSSAGSP